MAGTKAATEARSRRAALKRQMADMDQEQALAIVRGEGPEEQEDVAASMPIAQLLQAVPDVGPMTAHEVLAQRRINAVSPTYGLTLERRTELANAIRMRSTPAT